MHYDDHPRRFRVLGGLAAGVAVGTGLVLMVNPASRPSPLRPWWRR